MNDSDIKIYEKICSKCNQKKLLYEYRMYAKLGKLSSSCKSCLNKNKNMTELQIISKNSLKSTFQFNGSIC